MQADFTPLPPKTFNLHPHYWSLHSITNNNTTMGRLRRSRTHHARRDIQRAARTRVRTKDLDQIELDIKHSAKKFELQPIDEDKPGLGQYVSRGEAWCSR